MRQQPVGETDVLIRIVHVYVSVWDAVLLKGLKGSIFVRVYRLHTYKYSLLLPLGHFLHVNADVYLKMEPDGRASVCFVVHTEKPGDGSTNLQQGNDTRFSQRKTAMPSVQPIDLFRIQPLAVLPLWAVYVLTVILLLLAAEGGYRLSKAMQRRAPDQAETNVGALSGATLALLAFLLAFIMSSAVTSFTARRQAVVAEANAIGTTYLRAGYLPAPYDAESRELLREYVDTRLEALDLTRTAQAIARSEEIHTELWSRAETLARENPSPTIALYVSSLNEVIDLHTDRINVELVARLPWALVLGIYLIAILSMVLVGLHAGYGEGQNLIALLALVLVLAVVFLLIVDMGRGQEGLLTVSQQSMIDLQHQFNTP